MTTETLEPSLFPAVAPMRCTRRVLRSIGAVAAGLAAIFAVTSATDLVMHATGVFPPAGAQPMASGLFLLALAYRFIYDVAGSYLTARLAPHRPMGHALVLGSIFSARQN